MSNFKLKSSQVSFLLLFLSLFISKTYWLKNSYMVKSQPQAIKTVFLVESLSLSVWKYQKMTKFNKSWMYELMN